jgi:tetratricopeptide repeat protein 21B
LLEKSPDNFNTLSQLIELLRRAGRISELSVYLTNAEKACRRSNMAGLAFCKGLSHFYQNSPAEALKELNVAR